MAEFDQKLARRMMRLRQDRGLSLEAVSEATGVSRATLSRIERAETSPTAATLGLLAHAFEVSMADLFAYDDGVAEALVARDQQEVWMDPETGFVRRNVSPSQPGYRGSIVEGEIPAGQTVAYAKPPLPDLEHHVVALSGTLKVTLAEGDETLRPGDCLRFRLNHGNAFTALGPHPARYLICVVMP
ncbi:XRE family transcriptional regulator [Roseibium sp. RKSG952]|uniref:XRE family transcriptional regulator n=1 Tax=Roseibium sp. RKSG952 TaxID=2529384 RepID=UPI0012BC752E|nr:XRE family transcriptional regulator [Roseibium sp. RKSG952]MTH96581.1 XRE family transcriptional regulator [Roseibium sp. RKSG952]